jgi:hypothetical protein
MGNIIPYFTLLIKYIDDGETEGIINNRPQLDWFLDAAEEIMTIKKLEYFIMEIN